VDFWRNQRREKERQARADGRMPPGQSLTQKFPVLTYEPRSQWPSTDLRAWSLEVFGEVEAPLRLSFEDLITRFEVVEVTFDLHCVTRWSKLDTQWKGVRMRDVIDAAHPAPGANFLISHAATGYTSNVPIENARSDLSLITWEYDGVPLPSEHGGPVRGIVDPHNLYLWKGAKFLTGLELTSSDDPGFWERLGYHNRGDIWEEERFWSDEGISTRRDVLSRASRGV
jgi:DMSO/TMAO reductase YedYZ molybdopterin-dependent catalytic subunit